jgi:hypothetical protein
MKLVNLTPHTINIVGGEGGSVAIPPSGKVARCATKTVPVGTAEGIALSRISYGEVVDLPDPEEGTLFVVSALARAAKPDRTDVASPGDLVRDESGQPIGCRGLVVN